MNGFTYGEVFISRAVNASVPYYSGVINLEDITPMKIFIPPINLFKFLQNNKKIPRFSSFNLNFKYENTTLRSIKNTNRYEATKDQRALQKVTKGK